MSFGRVWANCLKNTSMAAAETCGINQREVLARGWPPGCIGPVHALQRVGDRQ
jgi:hypothetical protein